MCPVSGLELGKNIASCFDKFGTLLNESVAAAGQWIMDRTGEREYLAALLGGESRCNQRAAAASRFDHQRSEAQAADQPVALGKVPTFGRCTQRVFTHQRPVSRDGVCEIAVDSRVHAVDAGAEKCDRLTARIECALVCGSVDTLSQSANDGEAAAGQVLREVVCVAAAAFCRVATTNNSQGGQVQGIDIAINVKNQGWPGICAIISG